MPSTSTTPSSSNYISKRYPRQFETNLSQYSEILSKTPSNLCTFSSSISSQNSSKHPSSDFFDDLDLDFDLLPSQLQQQQYHSHSSQDWAALQAAADQLPTKEAAVKSMSSLNDIDISVDKDLEMEWVQSIKEHNQWVEKFASNSQQKRNVSLIDLVDEFMQGKREKH